MFHWQDYLPDHLPKPVAESGEFPFAAIGLDHAHIEGICSNLVQAGGTLKWVCDADAAKAKALAAKFPGAGVARKEDILDDPQVRLVVSDAIPSQRCALGIEVMEAGKDYLADKAPFTTLDQLALARDAVRRTGRKYMVVYGERVDSEASVYAGELLRQGVIGRVLQLTGLGPHRLNADSRPDWFFHRKPTGGILTDLTSHQAEQFLYYTGETQAYVASARTANFTHPQWPEFEDFGEALFQGAGGSSMYARVDWFTPDGLSAWGDGRTFILGSEGYIEMRKYTDLAVSQESETILLATHDGEYKFSVAGRVGRPFYGQLILDCLNRTEYAQGQAHAFRAAELSLMAQEIALRGKGESI